MHGEQLQDAGKAAVEGAESESLIKLPNQFVDAERRFFIHAQTRCAIVSFFPIVLLP